jgi:hypothetical protein
VATAAAPALLLQPQSGLAGAKLKRIGLSRAEEMPVVAAFGRIQTATACLQVMSPAVGSLARPRYMAERRGGLLRSRCPWTRRSARATTS